MPSPEDCPLAAGTTDSARPVSVDPGEPRPADPLRSSLLRRFSSTLAAERELHRHDRAMAALAVVGSALGAGLALSWPGLAASVRAALAALAIIAAAFYGLGWMALGRTPRRAHSRWPALASAVEVTLASAVLVVLAILGPAPTAAHDNVGAGAFFVAIALSGARLRPRLCLAATGLALLEWAVIDLWLLAPAAGAAWSWGHASAEWLWLVAAGAIATAGARALEQRAARVGRRLVRQLEGELSRYLSRGVARAILRGQVDVRRPQRRRVTVLFCDLRGFTFLCQRERPEDVVAMLDDFYERATGLVQRAGGIVNKLLGDGMLALFGAPEDLPDHAEAAADAAIAIMHMVKRLRERGGVWTHLAVGIGLDTGDVVVGAIGSKSRADYTAIGSPVNRAARLQSLGERESRRIIVSEATRQALGPRPIEPLGLVELKGFAAPEPAYVLRIRPPTAPHAGAGRTSGAGLGARAAGASDFDREITANDPTRS